MKVNKKSVIQEAKEIRDFTNRNKSLPKYATINGSQFTQPQYSYILAKQVNKINLSEINKRTVKEPSQPTGDNINTTLYKNEYLDLASRVATYIEQHNQAPNYAKYADKRISFELYTFCFAKILAFYKENNYLPNYCSFNNKDLQNTKTTTTNTKKTTNTSTSTSKKTVKKDNCSNPYTSSPHYTTLGCNKLGQCTCYFCGPHSIHQAIRKFGITKYSEKQIAGWCATTTKGTDHQGINTAIAKISKESGVKLTVQWKNFSDLGKDANARFLALAKLLCKKDTAVLTHIGYQGAGSSASGTIFGHYETLDKINTQTKYVRALNSLGNKKSDGSYQGHLQDRTYNLQATYFRNTPGGQKAICIITKG